jgi:antitoxin component of RelBE/YafQ-DinJ toxin-antitoxin module
MLSPSGGSAASARNSTIITVRVYPELKEAARKVAELRGMQLSDFIRQLIIAELARLGFLPEEVSKALGR